MAQPSENSWHPLTNDEPNGDISKLQWQHSYKNVVQNYVVLLTKGSSYDIVKFKYSHSLDVEPNPSPNPDQVPVQSLPGERGSRPGSVKNILEVSLTVI